MKIQIYNSLSLVNDKNLIIIADDISYKKITRTSQCVLVFTTGQNTLRAFKEIYVFDDQAAVRQKVRFVVKNLEHFLYKMKEFRNLQYEIISADTDDSAILNSSVVLDTRKEKRGRPKGKKTKGELKEPTPQPSTHFEYALLEDEIKKTLGTKDNKKGRKKLKYTEEEMMKTIKQLPSDSYNISFNPDIYGSVRTSLLRPDLYMEEENPSTEIFRRILEGEFKTVKEMTNSKEMEDVLRSFISCGIVKVKGDKIVIHEGLRK